MPAAAHAALDEATAAVCAALPDRYRADVRTRISSIDGDAWDRLAGPQPFVRHAYLAALEETGAACERTGWFPCHLILHVDDRLVAALPLYLKQHSWGEYVFDWAWADAYARHGLAYYPKLVGCVPFSPVSGTRLLAESEAAREQLVVAALALARALGVSSLHLLFANVDEAELCAAAGMMMRTGVQFRWENRGFRSFDDHLAAMNHTKRKKIRQERKKLADAGVRYRHLEGRDIGAAELAFLQRCYVDTYRRHGARPYLDLAFFQRLAADMPQALMLTVAERDGAPIACALNLRDARALYGRYWGTLADLPGLHFETCYHQGIEYCIAHGLERLEGGAQGEHKLARGLEPVRTTSVHWLAHPAFAAAVDEFLQREDAGVGLYFDELSERSPFRRSSGQR
ncbi:MAG: hypothetical protein AMXMBFR6_19580 [Betaproteobacteria bacterium]